VVIARPPSAVVAICFGVFLLTADGRDGIEGVRIEERSWLICWYTGGFYSYFWLLTSSRLTADGWQLKLFFS